VAKVSISGDMVPSSAIEAQVARICPLNSQWKWEAIAHDATSFLVNFPSFQDLERVNGIHMEVPNFAAHFKISKWETQDIQPKFDLPQLWVHVEGVPHTVRHFHGLWAIGSLLGTTVDVDLPTMYNQNIVRILVAMMNPDILNKHKDEKGYYVDTTVILKLQGFDFPFRKQTAGFQSDPLYTPFFWRFDDLEEDDSNYAKGKRPMTDHIASSSSNVSNMEVDGAATGQGVGPGTVHQRNTAVPLPASLSRQIPMASRGRPNMMGRTLPPRVQRMDADILGPTAVVPGTVRPLALEPLVQELVVSSSVALPTTIGSPSEELEVADTSQTYL
jgi:hypothetical protein